MNDKVYNEIRNRKERLKESLIQKLEEGDRENETLEIMLKMLENCKINVKDQFKGVEINEEA